MVNVKIATVSELWSRQNYDRQPKLWSTLKLRPFQNYGAVKIMTLHHNFDWRQMRKKRAEMDLLKYKLKINHSTLCVRLPKDQCHTQLQVLFTDQY